MRGIGISRSGAGLTAVVLCCLLVALTASAPAATRGARGASTTCPNPAALIRPKNLRGAIPAAKAALGTPGHVLQVKRGPKSAYAASAKRACGVRVLRKSVYVVVHPNGMTCAACNLHAYVVKFRGGPWKVWTGY